MNKVIKRQLYHIIQTSVDVIYNLEEDTISIANEVLDNFLKTYLHEILLEQMTIEHQLRYNDQMCSAFENRRKQMHSDTRIQKVKTTI